MAKAASGEAVLLAQVKTLKEEKARLEGKVTFLESRLNSEGASLKKLEDEAKNGRRLRSALRLVRDLCDHALGGWDKEPSSWMATLLPLLAGGLALMAYFVRA